MGEIIIKVNGIFRKTVLSSLVVGLFVCGKANTTASGEMPNNPRVQSGSVKITGTGTNHLQINTKTNKEHTEMMSISEMEEYLTKNKHIKHYFSVSPSYQ